MQSMRAAASVCCDDKSDCFTHYTSLGRQHAWCYRNYGYCRGGCAGHDPIDTDSGKGYDIGEIPCA